MYQLDYVQLLGEAELHMEERRKRMNERTRLLYVKTSTWRPYYDARFEIGTRMRFIRLLETGNGGWECSVVSRHVGCVIDSVGT